MTTHQIEGACLCGDLAYSICTESGEIYQCHCSKCRKLSGSTSNSNLVVQEEHFVWKKEPLSLKIFKTAEDWESPFCGTCGSVAPLYDTCNKVFYVPAGSLQNNPILKITKHKHLSSKANWDT